MESWRGIQLSPHGKKCTVLGRRANRRRDSAFKDEWGINQEERREEFPVEGTQ